MEHPTLSYGAARQIVRFGLIAVPFIVSFILTEVFGVDRSHRTTIIFYVGIGWLFLLLIVERWTERHDPALDVAPDENREQAFADLFDLDENHKK